MSIERDEIIQNWINDFVDMYNRQPTLETIQEWEIRLDILYEDMWDDGDE